MARVVITAPVTASGLTFKKGDVIEASAALVTALGASARTPVFRDQTGEPFAASNSTD